MILVKVFFRAQLLASDSYRIPVFHVFQLRQGKGQKAHSFYPHSFSNATKRSHAHLISMYKAYRECSWYNAQNYVVSYLNKLAL